MTQIQITDLFTKYPLSLSKLVESYNTKLVEAAKSGGEVGKELKPLIEQTEDAIKFMLSASAVTYFLVEFFDNQEIYVTFECDDKFNMFCHVNFGTSTWQSKRSHKDRITPSNEVFIKAFEILETRLKM